MLVPRKHVLVSYAPVKLEYCLILTIIPSREVELDTYVFIDVILDLWPNLASETMNRSTSAAVSGSTYKLGCMVSYCISDLVPQFGKLIHILSPIWRTELPLSCNCMTQCVSMSITTHLRRR
jgi:hypothetical protein